MQKWMVRCALAGGMGISPIFASVARAQDAGAEADGPNNGALTISGGADYTTAYYFRGYNQEDARLIVQPWITLGASLLDSDDLDVSAYVGTWNSIHEQPTPGNSSIYETDYYAGVDFAFGPVTVGGIYTAYTYPGDVFGDIQEVGVKVSFDDAEFMKSAKIPFALKPYVGLYKEISDDNATTSGSGPAIFANDGSNDAYLEFGLAPSCEVNDALTLTVPVVFGCSLDDYYQSDDGDNEFLGYVSVGLMASTPLPLPARYGSWTLTGGVTYLYLAADSTQDLNEEPSNGGIGNGENSVFIGKLGVSFSY